MRIYLVIFIIFAAFSTNVQAYIGPGLGAGTVGVVLGVIASIFLTLLAIIYYPIKRLLKKRRRLGKKSGEEKSSKESD